MVVGQPAHVASAPKLCPKGVVVELKRGIVEGKGGNEGEGGRPGMLGLHLIPTFILHFILLLSCSLHLPKSSKVTFHSFLKFFLFIFFEIFRFYIMQ
jgi:hypothetical protein